MVGLYRFNTYNYQQYYPVGTIGIVSKSPGEAYSRVELLKEIDVDNYHLAGRYRTGVFK